MRARLVVSEVLARLAQTGPLRGEGRTGLGLFFVGGCHGPLVSCGVGKFRVFSLAESGKLNVAREKGTSNGGPTYGSEYPRIPVRGLWRDVSQEQAPQTCLSENFFDYSIYDLIST
jgi:hypothetical protein